MNFHPNDVQRAGARRVGDPLSHDRLPDRLVLPGAGAAALAVRARVGEEPAARGADPRAARPDLRPHRRDHRGEHPRVHGVAPRAGRRLAARDAPRACAAPSSSNDEHVDAVVKRYRRNPNRPAVIFGDASFDLVSVLEEHRVEFPGLIIQSAPEALLPRRCRGRGARRLHRRNHGRTQLGQPGLRRLQVRAASGAGGNREAVRDPAARTGGHALRGSGRARTRRARGRCARGSQPRGRASRCTRTSTSICRSSS